MSTERTRILPALFNNPDKEKDSQAYFSHRLFLSIAIITIGLLFLSSANRHHGEHDNGAGVSPATPFLTASEKKKIRHENPSIRPGSIFLDTEGDPINAHGGGFLFHGNTYYWYGEIKSGRTYLPKANADWGGTRVDLVGISCYSSKDLLNWENRGNVLPAVTNDTRHDLYRDNVAERPKVVFNERTGKFVMWLHIDGADYARARCGVATSDRPTGPFEYLGSFRPNGGQMARDLTVFVDDDDDGSAYLFTSSEDNASIHISRLADDYLTTKGNHSRIFVGRYMEAPTIFKHDGKYYMIMSGCTAWKPNAARSAVTSSSSIWGPWTELGNPCRSEGSNTTFRSQSTYVLPVVGNSERGGDNYTRFIFAADRWIENNLSDSRYVWLPLTFDTESDNPIIKWYDEWNPSWSSGAWSKT